MRAAGSGGPWWRRARHWALAPLVLLVGLYSAFGVVFLVIPGRLTTAPPRAAARVSAPVSLGRVRVAVGGGSAATVLMPHAYAASTVVTRPNTIPYPTRRIEHRAHRQAAREPMARNGLEPRRGNAAAVDAVGLATELAWRDARRQIGRHAGGHLGEEAVVWRGWGIGVDRDQLLRHAELREPGPKTEEIGDDHLTVLGLQPLG